VKVDKHEKIVKQEKNHNQKKNHNIEEIQIKTGARISNILQSTVTYAQAFTELVKNSMQNGATFVEITLSGDNAIIKDNGIGFDHNKDENGMNGFEKYFVFGNSYDMSNGVGPTLGQMGIGGKIANDKLSDNDNTHWTIETKNSHDKSFLVTYKPGKTEFLDEYSPSIEELTETNITTETGTIVTIHNLDLPIIKEGWNISRITKELKDFFGFLVRSGNNEFNVILNGKSLQFDYTLPGYVFPSIDKTIEVNVGDEIKNANINFNLSLMQNSADIVSCPLDGVIVVSGVKVCDLKYDKEEIIKKVYAKISDEVGSEIAPQTSVRNLFTKLRGFVVCEELSSLLDHTGMPAKDLSHHALREDHPLTIPFYTKVYEVLTDLLRGFLLLNSKQNTNKLEILANNVVRMITNDMKIDEKYLINLGIKTPTFESAETRMIKVKVADDIIGNLIKAEINNKTKKAKRKRRKRKELQNKLLAKNEKKQNKKNNIKIEIPAELQQADNGKFIEDENGEERKFHDPRGIPYQIKPFGSGYEKIMSDFEHETNFCVYINSENHKFVSFNNSGDNLGLALHIAESIIRELTRFTNPTASKNELDEKLSDFYLHSYAKLRKNNLFQ
jgi:hypothetical protein